MVFSYYNLCDSWCILGDFNVVLSVEDVKGGVPRVQFHVLSFLIGLILMSLLRLHLLDVTTLGQTFKEECIILIEYLIKLFVIFLILRIGLHVMLMFYLETSRIIIPWSFFLSHSVGVSKQSFFQFLKMWKNHMDCRSLINNSWNAPTSGCPLLILQRKLQ